MNDICELWSLPWHVLQKSLAKGMSNRGVVRGAETFRDIKAQSATVSAGSWLSRAQGRGTSLRFP
jgi:hypothetical protein